MAAKSAASDDYGSRVSNMVISGFAVLGLALGQERGLFKAMDELGRPATAAEVATAADCKERYVREWLLQMSMARVVEMDDTGTLFNLPEGGMAALSKVIHIAAYLPRASMAHLELLEAFTTSGPRGISEASGMVMLKQQLKNKAPFWTGMFNADATEDMATMVTAMEQGAKVLDIGCSTGDCCLTVGSQFPMSTFYGIDIIESDIQQARKKAKDRRLSNVTFEAFDAAKLPDAWTDLFDIVLVFDTFHDIPFLQKAVGEFARVLKKGGTCFITENILPSHPKEQLDHHSPVATVLYTLSMYHCVPLAMNTEGGEAYGACMGKDRIKAVMVDAGFECVSLRPRSCSYSADRMQHIYMKKQ